MIAAGKLDRRIRIERPIKRAGFGSAGSGTWEPVAEVWAEVQDMLPSRGERLAEGLNIATRPARVRIRYRAGIEASMRVLVGRNRTDGAGGVEWHTDRVAQITTVPAEIGRREGLEFMIEDYTSAGNAA